MRTIAVILLLVTSICATEAQKIFYFPHDSIWIDVKDKKKSRIDFVSYTDVAYVLVDNVYVYLSILETRKTDLKMLLGGYTSSSVIETDTSGYRYFVNDAKGFSSSKPFRTYVLSGGDILLLAHHSYNKYDKLSFSGCVNDFIVKASMEEGQKQRRGTLYDKPLQYKYLDSGLLSITSSSYLTEEVNGKLVDYRPEYMMNRICKTSDGWEFEPEFDNFMRCWAEGVPGDGIGEWLKVDFTRVSDELLILNGYIDFGNMNAYKNNSRLRRIRIDSTAPAFSVEYTFDDYVAYHSVKLPAVTKSVKITILDVYKGAKYSDTCVTAITLPQERWRTKETEEKEVRAYLQKLGVLDYIKKFKARQE